MQQNALVQCFLDTQRLARSAALQEKTAAAQASNKVYPEGFRAAKRTAYKKRAEILVKADTTFSVARKYCSVGRVAVLNFANPETPGGGVQNGAMAQEECLCRSSNLYACLCAENVFTDYYLYHRTLHNAFYSDRVIYTKNITVFKDDSEVPQIMPKEAWFTVDVITCAAPYLAKRKYTNLTALKHLFKQRIQNILETAIDNEAEVIVLGAFGCGAFKNPPNIVSEAFREVICGREYRDCFRKIVFAIKSSNAADENFSVFFTRFAQDAPDAEWGCTILPGAPEWRFYRTPKLPNHGELEQSVEFREWQGNNPYFGKQFSVLGDSISTLSGYNPQGNEVFYNGAVCAQSGVCAMEDTWWGKVIDFFGGELLVNNSWSGSRVTQTSNATILFPSGCSDERTSRLHIHNVLPDVILIYLGFNDWASGVEVKKRLIEKSDYTKFSFAYAKMLAKLKANYRHAEIWCCTLNTTYIADKPAFSFPHTYAGQHIENYNQMIRKAAKRYGCKIIDLYNYHVAYDTLDGSHPTAAGMNTLASLVIREAARDGADRFINTITM